MCRPSPEGNREILNLLMNTAMYYLIIIAVVCLVNSFATEK